MSAELVWTGGAERDLQEIYEHMFDGAGEDLAAEFMQTVDKSVGLLREFPEIAPVFIAPIRRLLVGKGRHGVFYSIQPRGVIIHAVQDLRQNPESILRRLGL